MRIARCVKFTLKGVCFFVFLLTLSKYLGWRDTLSSQLSRQRSRHKKDPEWVNDLLEGIQGWKRIRTNVGRSYSKQSGSNAVENQNINYLKLPGFKEKENRKPHQDLDPDDVAGTTTPFDVFSLLTQVENGTRFHEPGITTAYTAPPSDRSLVEVVRLAVSRAESAGLDPETAGYYSSPVNLQSTQIFDVERVHFMTYYRNPCWTEPLPSGNPYQHNRYGGKTRGYMSHLSPVWGDLVTNWRDEGRTSRVRCLPYFMIGGFPKCGTTDIYNMLTEHQDITKSAFKEPHYWTRWRHWTDKCFWKEFMCADGTRCVAEAARCDGRRSCPDGSDEEGCEPPGDCAVNNGGCSHICSSSICSCPQGMELKRDKKTCVGGVPLSDYVDLFDPAAEIMNRENHVANVTVDNRTVLYRTMVTGEATPATFWDNHRWRDEPSNYRLPDGSEPRTLTAHMLAHVLPKLKMVVMVRDPATRLYSDYLYFLNGDSRKFHEKVVQGLEWFDKCLRNYTLRACVYQPMHAERPPEGRYWNPVERIRIGLYSVYVEDWMKVYNDPDSLLVVRLEDYKANKTQVLSQVVQFLQLGPVNSGGMKSWGRTHVLNSGFSKYKTSGLMLPETQQLLRDFYRPYNRRLAEMLKDKRFQYDR